MKTPGELNAFKAEVETLSKKLYELTEEEINLIIGDDDISTERICDICGQPIPTGVSYGQHLHGYHGTTRMQVTPKGLMQPDNRK